MTTVINIETQLPESDAQEGIAGGLCYCDSAGVNLQVLPPSIKVLLGRTYLFLLDLIALFNCSMTIVA